MIIVMKPEATTAELEAVKNKITDAGLNFHLSQGSTLEIGRASRFFSYYRRCYW